MGRRQQAGFTYLALLFFTALMGTTLAAAGVVWSIAQQREKERELLFVGNSIRKAIASYYESSPGTVKRYPTKLEDLLKDDRHLAIVRHLRRIYLDPMTLEPQWGLVRAPDGGIKGVYSLSMDRAIKRGGFRGGDVAFEGAETYNNWRFEYEPTSLKATELGGL